MKLNHNFCKLSIKKICPDVDLEDLIPFFWIVHDFDNLKGSRKECSMKNKLLIRKLIGKHQYLM